MEAGDSAGFEIIGVLRESLHQQIHHLRHFSELLGTKIGGAHVVQHANQNVPIAHRCQRGRLSGRILASDLSSQLMTVGLSQQPSGMEGIYVDGVISIVVLNDKMSRQPDSEYGPPQT